MDFMFKLYVETRQWTFLTKGYANKLLNKFLSAINNITGHEHVRVFLTDASGSYTKDVYPEFGVEDEKGHRNYYSNSNISKTVVNSDFTNFTNLVKNKEYVAAGLIFKNLTKPTRTKILWELSRPNFKEEKEFLSTLKNYNKQSGGTKRKTRKRVAKIKLNRNTTMTRQSINKRQ